MLDRTGNTDAIDGREVGGRISDLLEELFRVLSAPESLRKVPIQVALLSKSDAFRIRTRLLEGGQRASGTRSP